jgi:putative spermidine/putrescine transport system ATP-binding protein
MSVAANVGFPLSVRGVPAAERRTRVAEALEMVRLGGFAARRPSELSGGQQQRVALARALVFRPAVVLMDEPLGALDRQLREEMQAEIRALHRTLGVTIVYVTHDQGEALGMSDRVAVFQGGVLQQVATPRALYDTPANLFVAGFVGECNFLPCRIAETQDDETRITLGDGRSLCIGASSLPAGAPALLAVRPEAIAIVPARAEDLGADALPARVRDVVFLGEVVRITVEMSDGRALAVRRPAAAVGAAIAPGAQVALAWQPGHARLFPPQDQAGTPGNAASTAR